MIDLVLFAAALNVSGLALPLCVITECTITGKHLCCLVRRESYYVTRGKLFRPFVVVDVRGVSLITEALGEGFSDL